MEETEGGGEGTRGCKVQYSEIWAGDYYRTLKSVHM